MQLIIWMFRRSDLSRSRAMVQEIADERIKARRKLDETERKAARALEEAKRLDEADFRMRFEKRIEPQTAFLPSVVRAGAEPTPFDAWEFTRSTATGRKGKPTFKPSQPYPIRSLYIEHPVAG